MESGRSSADFVERIEQTLMCAGKRMETKVAVCTSS